MVFLRTLMLLSLFLLGSVCLGDVAAYDSPYYDSVSRPRENHTCNPTNNATFSDRFLLEGQAMAPASPMIRRRRLSHRPVRKFAIHLTSNDGVVSDLFLGGSSTMRPFGGTVLDGVDLDIEGGASTGCVAFVTEIRSLVSGAS
ncbi:glycoside hydrolase family 18 protein [Paxillus rubicundulus Ve08.2h10]|uniref:Glycoside hydrolase family 18 protein n=1 Tax=Paxillus rubicundulus Ve08.2h10 TaxID=930991 RepID=A0A0D0DZ28_9AGAM|nr:glycoside hydrolase family 18 protein [Paxillus rubicundulus Ve08.2h10]